MVCYNLIWNPCSLFGKWKTLFYGGIPIFSLVMCEIFPNYKCLLPMNAFIESFLASFLYLQMQVCFLDILQITFLVFRFYTLVFEFVNSLNSLS